MKGSLNRSSAGIPDTFDFGGRLFSISLLKHISCARSPGGAVFQHGEEATKHVEAEPGVAQNVPDPSSHRVLGLPSFLLKTIWDTPPGTSITRLSLFLPLRNPFLNAALACDGRNSHTVNESLVWTIIA